jgi:uncharacterized protein
MPYVGFDRDDGNARKNEKHGVTNVEIEQVFLNNPLVIAEDVKHSNVERRFHALGRTDADRRLHITFTELGDGTLVRPISARDMHRKEKTVYEKAVEAHS